MKKHVANIIVMFVGSVASYFVTNLVYDSINAKKAKKIFTPLRVVKIK